MTEDRIDWIANCHCPSGVAFPHDVKQAIKAALREASAPTQGADARPVAISAIDMLNALIPMAENSDSPVRNFSNTLVEIRKALLATRDAAPSDAQAPGLDKFLFVPPNSEAESGWNAAIVHVTAHLQFAASPAASVPVGIVHVSEDESWELSWNAPPYESFGVGDHTLYGAPAEAIDPMYRFAKTGERNPDPEVVKSWTKHAVYLTSQLSRTRDSMIEECAKECDRVANQAAKFSLGPQQDCASSLADNIRALKSQQDAAIESQRSGNGESS